MRFDRKQFFDGVRGKLISKMSQQQVDAIEFLLGKFETSRCWSSLRHIAYAFATIAHETAWTFKPIKEFRSAPGSKGRANQDRYWHTGFYGRGYVQLTWERNYRHAAEELSVDLVGNPVLALDPAVAFEILTAGMFEGWFTRRVLDDFITPTATDYLNARRVINGTDKAETIANIAKRFEAILRVAEVDEDIPDLGQDLTAGVGESPSANSASDLPTVSASGTANLPESSNATPAELPQPSNVIAQAGHQPMAFTAFIPQIDTAKGYFKRLFAGGSIATAAAFLFGLPMWLQVSLALLVLFIVAGGIVVFVKYHDRVFAYVTAMNTLRATEGVHNPVVSSQTPK